MPTSLGGCKEKICRSVAHKAALIPYTFRENVLFQNSGNGYNTDTT